MASSWLCLNYAARTKPSCGCLWWPLNYSGCSGVLLGASAGEWGRHYRPTHLAPSPIGQSKSSARTSLRPAWPAISSIAMHHQPSRFIQNHEVGIFVEDVEGNVLGGEFQGLGLGDGDGDGVSDLHGGLFVGAVLAVEGDVFPIDQLLDAVAG